MICLGNFFQLSPQHFDCLELGKNVGKRMMHDEQCPCSTLITRGQCQICCMVFKSVA